ncbi:hypothetical protein BGZ89_010931 [Linnemannia elongata]|nr:hypothetical protein BGZ89_010931 [Linnemannia elongata]
MGNPFEDFTATEKRNVMIYMAGIMLYKFGLEAFTGSITLLATDLFKAENRFSNLAVLQGLNQAFQCVGSIAIAPLIRRFPTRSVLSASIFLFGLLSAIIIIIDVSTGGRIPENGVKRHGQWNSVILFPIYSIIGICHGMVELIRRVIPRDIVGGDVIKLKRMDAIVHVFYEIAGTAGAFFSTFLILKLGNAIAPAMTPFLFILSSVAWSFIGLLEADHDNRRRLETLEEHSLLRQIGHGSNFGELLGALFVLFFAKVVKTPIPWLRLDALGLLIVWVLPYAYPAKENALTFAWTLAAIWIPVSFGWAAGDDIHPALLRVGGIMYSVVCVILLLATFIPKGSFALNPNLIDDTQIEDEEEEYRKQQALQHDEIKEIKTQQHEVKA